MFLLLKSVGEGGETKAGCSIGSLYTWLEEFMGDMARPLGRYNVVNHVDSYLLSMFPWSVSSWWFQCQLNTRRWLWRRRGSWTAEGNKALHYLRTLGIRWLNGNKPPINPLRRSSSRKGPLTSACILRCLGISSARLFEQQGEEISMMTRKACPVKSKNLVVIV